MSCQPMLGPSRMLSDLFQLRLMISGMKPGKSPVDRPRGPGTAWVWAIVLGLIIVALETGGDSLRLLLRYDRAAIGTGQLWRFLSAHVVHLGWGHALLNVAAFLLILWLFGEGISPARWVLAALGAALAVDVGLWALHPEVSWYVGMSGILHGLLASAGVWMIRTAPGIGIAVLAALGAKIGWETMSGPLPMSAELSGGDVIVQAHLWGAIGGIVSGIVMGRPRRPDAPV